MSSVTQDLSYGLRVLRKSPGFAIVAVLVLALGIGANTAIFSVVNAVLLRPLPFAEPSRIVHVWHVPPPKSFPGITRFSVSPANYLDWARTNRVFEKIAIYGGRSMNLTGGGKPEFVRSATVSADFFPVLGVKPILGRTFLPGEDQLGHDHEVVLTYEFWQSRFGGDRSIVGRQITLNDEAYSVIGVMGPDFMFPAWEEKLWTPMAWTPKEAAVRDNHSYLVVARLRPGVEIKQAQAEMTAISDRLARQYPADDKDWGALVVPLREDIVGDVRPALLVLLGAVAFVLLIACANVANLLLARALARTKEVAIRTALGASRARIIQQLLFETLILALAGGAVGLVVAKFGLGLIIKFLGQQLPRSTEIGLDGPVLAFTLLISVLTGILAGLLPAWRMSNSNVNETLKQGMGRAGDSGGNRTRAALVVCEVALSLVLLAGAGLMIRTLWNLRNANPGFDLHNVLTTSLPVPGTKYKTPQEEISFWNRVLERVRALPGVEAAGVVDDLPFNGGSHQPIMIEGRPPVPMAEQPEVDVRVSSTGYLQAMHIPLLRGRDFNDSDTADRPGVILISEAMAKRFWPGEDAVGKRLTLWFFRDKPREIVGIVGDVKLDGLDQKDTNSALYMPMTQLSAGTGNDWRSGGFDMVVRTKTPPGEVAPALTNAIHEIDPEQAVLHTMTMEDFTAESIAPQRFNMLLLATFAGLALLLAAMGIYSVLSYSVRRRVREIGIRMALGAQIRDVLRLVIFDGMKPALIGLGIGIIGALVAGRVMANLVFGVKTSDPATFTAVSVLLGGVALVATIVPAFRATKVDPMRTLREE
ncbi:MAG TPA: ABC transporter permease [Candidatus Angelobacter sp.]|nr:ABC transporter permease [Candidatus Angelobacter sp.]